MSESQRYHRLESLGKGSWAEVHRALDVELRRQVAVKELQGSADLVSPLASSSFEREVRVVSYLDHPGILPLFDRLGGEGDPPAYTMRVVEGITLEKRIVFEKSTCTCYPQSIASTVRILERLAETLAYAHDRGILHLDLKPANIMIGRYGEVFLLDWGNSRLYNPEPYLAYLGDHATGEDLEVLSQEPVQRITGTALFMSPEQIDGDRASLLPASDVFSAGALFYMLLFGRPPFLKSSLPETFLAIQSQELPDLEHLARLRSGVPPRLAEIIMRMLAKEPAERYSDFHAVLEALEDYRAGGSFSTVQLKAGEVLFQEGEAGTDSYGIISGSVRVEREGDGGTRHLSDLGPGEIVGELAILTEKPRSATVMALEDTTLTVLPRERVQAELEKLEPWMGTMIESLASRFLERLSAGDS